MKTASAAWSSQLWPLLSRLLTPMAGSTRPRGTTRYPKRKPALFSLDAFGGGFIVQSLLALWLFKRFGISLSAASLFFFWTSVLSALSYPLASWLARHFGLVNTMVFTHIPSSICPLPPAFAPNHA